MTSAPNSSAISPKRSPNTPTHTFTTLSPGDSVFTIAASIAPVPDDVIMYRSFFVSNTCFTPSVVRCSKSLYSGPRWLIICHDIDSRMSSGTGMGPGVRRFTFSLPPCTRFYGALPESCIFQRHALTVHCGATGFVNRICSGAYRTILTYPLTHRHQFRIKYIPTDKVNPSAT